MAYSGEEKRAYQRQWIAKRRTAWIIEHGPCVVCGSWLDLEVDHEDPTQKLLNPATLWGMSPKNPKRIAELAKCRVLCSLCHKLKSAREAPKGERTGAAKLNADKVRLIFSSTAPSRVLARLYGVDEKAIRLIRRGESWRHVTQGR